MRHESSIDNAELFYTVLEQNKEEIIKAVEYFKTMFFEDNYSISSINRDFHGFVLALSVVMGYKMGFKNGYLDLSSLDKFFRNNNIPFRFVAISNQNHPDYPNISSSLPQDRICKNNHLFCTIAYTNFELMPFLLKEKISIEENDRRLQNDCGLLNVYDIDHTYTPKSWSELPLAG